MGYAVENAGRAPSQRLTGEAMADVMERFQFYGQPGEQKTGYSTDRTSGGTLCVPPLCRHWGSSFPSRLYMVFFTARRMFS